MKLSDAKEVSPLKPSKEGNIVFLKSLPEYIEGDKGDSYKVEFVDTDGKTFSQTIFDPFNTPDTVKEALVQAGFTKIMRLTRAFMETEKYNVFAETDFPDLKTLINTFKRDVAKDWASTEAKIIFGWRKYDGFLSLPTFDNWISTKYAEDNDLSFPESELSDVYVANPVKPRPVKDGATAGATPDKEVKKSVSDEV